MTKRKTGKPRALEEESETKQKGPSLEEFVREMHSSAERPQNGLPTLDWLKSQFRTKSACIRFLINQGHAVKVIAKHLDTRYQQVRNVSKNVLKRGPNEDWRGPLLTPQPNSPASQLKTGEKHSGATSTPDASGTHITTDEEPT